MTSVNNPSKKNPSKLKRLIFLVVVFFFGYSTHAFFDFNLIKQYSDLYLFPKQNKLNNNLIDVPSPKLEFYTLLSKDNNPKEVGQKKEELPKLATTIAKAAINKSEPILTAAKSDIYYLQIVSYKSKDDANKMKASLTLKGYDAKITEFSQDGQTWFRVVIGPYNSVEQVKFAQKEVHSREHLFGIIRKLNA